MTLTTAQRFAAAEVLCDWPEDMDFEQILDNVWCGHPDVIISEVYENDPPEYVVDQIKGIHKALISCVATMTEDLRNAINSGNPLKVAEQLRILETELEVA